MSKESRQAVRAVFLAAIMVISVFAAGVAFSGSAAAEVTEISDLTAEDVRAGESIAGQEVTLTDVNNTQDQLGDITVDFEGNPNVTIKSVELVDSGDFGSGTVDVGARNDGGLFVTIDESATATSSITIQVTLDTTNADPGTVTYTADTPGGATASGDFKIRELGIEHDPNSAGATGTGSFIAEDLQITSTNGNPISFGSDSTFEFRIENSSGSTVTVQPQSGEQTVDAENFEFDIYDGKGAINEAPKVYADGTEINVTVSGDTGMFAAGVATDSTSKSDPFGEYTISLVDASGDDLIDSTGPRLIGIGYNIGDGIQQNSTTGNVEFTIPRASLNQDVDSDWTAEFSIGLAPDYKIEPTDISNAGDQFQVTVDVSGIEAGDYDYNLDLYRGDASDFNDRVIGIFEVDGVTIESSDSTDGSGSESDGILTVDADEGPYETISGGLRNAEDGDTVVVEDGSYSNSTGLTVTTPNVTLTADEGASPTFTTSPGNASGTAAIDVQAEGVTVSGLTVERVAASDRESTSGYAQGIVVRSSNVTVENNDVVGDLSATSNEFDRFSGIVVIDPSDTRGTTENVDILNNDVSGFDTGVLVTTFFNGTVSDVTISDTDATDNRVGFAAKIHNADGSISGVSGSGNDFTGSDEESIVFSPESYQGFSGLQSIPTKAINFNGPILVEDGDSIQTAVDVAAEGATIDVGSGTYNESVSIKTTNITLKGPNAGIDAASDDRNQEANITKTVAIYSNNVTVDGFTISNKEGDFNDDNIHPAIGIGPKSTNGVEIRNNVVREDEFGLLEGSASDLLIEGNLFTTSIDTAGIATYFWSDSDIEVSDNTFKTEDIDISLGDTSGSLEANISENEFYGGGEFGVTVVGHAEVNISDNEFINTTKAIRVPSDAKEYVVNAHRNDLSGAETGVYNKGPEPVDATNNWWGATSGPNNTDNSFIAPGESEQGAKVTGDVEFTPWLNDSIDDNGQPFAPVTNDNGGQFASIQAAVDDASSGDVIIAKYGNYNESVDINTQNVTVTGQRNDTVIEGLVTVDAQEAELREVRVDPPTFGPGSESQAVLVTASEATVDDAIVEIDVEVTEPDGFFKAQAIQVFASDSSPISDVVISDNVVVGTATQSNDALAGVTGISDQGNTTDTLIVNNDIDVASEGYSFGVVTRASAGENAVGTPSSEVLFNNITAIGGTLNGVGYGIESTSNPGAGSNGAQVDAEAQLVKYNNFEQIDSIEHKAASGTLDLTVNTWEDPSEVQFLTDAFGDSIQDGGEIVYDPVLTEEKNVTRFDELLAETDSGETIATTRDYGSYLQLASDGEPTVVGFSARPDGNLSEVLPETITNPSGDQAFALFVYDNDAQQFVPVSGSYEPEAGEVVVVTASAEFSTDFVVPVDTGDESVTSIEPPAAPSQIQINEGWNLLATGAANAPDDPIASSEILVGGQFQTQPAQPGAPAAEVQAYDGTWIFADDDGVLTTGYVPGQAPTAYSEFVLTPDTDNSDDDS